MSRSRISIIGLLLFLIFSFYNIQGQYLVEEFRPKIKNTPSTASHIVQGDGKIVVLGDYSFVGDSAVANLLRFHPDGQLDTHFTPSIELTQKFSTDFSKCCGRARIFKGVNTDLVLMADGFKRRVSIIDNAGQLKSDILTPSGYFQIEQIIRHKDGYVATVHKTGIQQSVIRFDQNGHVDPSFFRISYNGYVDDLIVDSDNNVLLVGDLTIDGVGRNLIRISESGVLDNSLNNISISVFFAEIDLFPDGRILISSGTQLVLLDANANLIESFTPNLGGSQIYSSVIDPVNERIIILIEQYPLPVAIKALELDGSVSDLFSTINVKSYGAVARILYHNGKFIMTTGFGEIEFNGTSQSFLVFDTFGNVLTDISTREKIFTVGQVEAAVALEDGSIVVGGKFSHVGNVQVNNLAKLDKAGNVDDVFDSNNPLSLGDEIKEIKISPNGQLYIGGFFHDILDKQQNSLIRINTDGELDLSFVTNKTSKASGRFLNNFIIMSDRIIACGAYYQDVVAFDFSGNDVATFNNSIFGSQNVQIKSLYKISEDNFAISGELLNGKGFLWIVDTDGNIDNAFVRQDDIPISSDHIVKVGNELFRSGSIIGGQGSADSNFIYKYSLETGEIEKSNFSTKTISVNKHLLALNDSTVFISGKFDRFNESEAHNFAASDFDGQYYERLKFNISPDNEGYHLVKTVAISEEETLLLGQFNTINNKPFYSIALLNNNNYIPEVDVNESYSIPEDTRFYISDLISIVDLDDEVQLWVVDNDNFSIGEDGMITLRKDFNGTIDLSFSVSDPFSLVGPFNTTLEITPVNDAPEIIAQLVVPNILPGEKYEILLSLLDVIDVDSDDLTMAVKPGENYSLLEGTSILSDNNFSGVLNVNLEISDGLLSSEFIFHVESSHPLGVDREYEFEVYPNPSTDYFKIDSFEDIEHVIIYSLDGRKLIDYDYSYLKNNENTIETSKLPHGIYIVNILLKSKKRFNTKLIKN